MKFTFCLVVVILTATGIISGAMRSVWTILAARFFGADSLSGLFFIMGVVGIAQVFVNRIPARWLLWIPLIFDTPMWWGVIWYDQPKVYFVMVIVSGAIAQILWTGRGNLIVEVLSTEVSTRRFLNIKISVDQLGLTLGYGLGWLIVVPGREWMEYVVLLWAWLPVIGLEIWLNVRLKDAIQSQSID